MSKAKAKRLEVDPYNICSRDFAWKVAMKIATVAHNQWHARHIAAYWSDRDAFVFEPSEESTFSSSESSIHSRLGELLLKWAEDILREMRERKLARRILTEMHKRKTP